MIPVQGDTSALSPFRLGSSVFSPAVLTSSTSSTHSLPPFVPVGPDRLPRWRWWPLELAASFVGQALLVAILVEGTTAVTGVSGEGQVGQAVAKALAENGAQLAICARKQSNVEARAQELRDAGASVFAMVGSLTDEGQVQRLIDGTVSEYGRIDVLVNLAGGLTRYKTAVEHSLDDWRAEVDNNLLSAFLTSRAAFPHLQAAGDGVIINFARAGLPQANMVAYNCAKAGIEALTRTLALEGRDLSIRVNAIAPGLVDTASNIAVMKPKDLKRWTKREDIAETVLFLASPAAAGITGQVIAVTGWGL